jgi:hypothetical protein
MALTKVSYSMITGSPVNVLDYASLVVTQTGPLRGVDPATGWLGSSYEDWCFAIQAAFDAAEGGSVLLPNRGTPYIVSDVIILRTNTTFYCDGEIKLGNSTNGGGIAGTYDGTTDCVIYDLKVDGSNIYTGSSGENGWGFGGSNHRLIGGHIKNCARGVGGPADGGKGIQNETEYGNIIISNVTFTNCFMAISTRQEHILHVYDCGPQIFSNITAEDCGILLFVEYAGIGSVPDGKKHSVILNGFSARNCGSFEGALQFSNAGNVLVSDGLIINTDFTTPAFIRGRHRYCQFSNLQFSGDCTSVLNNRLGTYSGLSAVSENNVYQFSHIGSIEKLINSDVAVISARQIFNSTINCDVNENPSVAIIGDNVASDSTECVITYRTLVPGSTTQQDNIVLRGTTNFIKAYYATFNDVTWTGDVIGNCIQGAWTPTVTSSAGTITTVSDVVGLFRKVGRSVTLYLTFTITDNGTGSGVLLLSTSTLPASVTLPLQGSTGTFTENNVGPSFGFAYNPGTGGNPIGLFKYDVTYPGVTGGKYSCTIQYSVPS